jgi:hypothetical protein
MQLRKLDIDDLIILSLLLAGYEQKYIAAEMGITQPAISQRLFKINTAFEVKIYSRITREGKLTVEGRQFASKAKDSLKLLTETSPYAFSEGRGKMLIDLIFEKKTA